MIKFSLLFIPVLLVSCSCDEEPCPEGQKRISYVVGMIPVQAGTMTIQVPVYDSECV